MTHQAAKDIHESNPRFLIQSYENSRLLCRKYHWISIPCCTEDGILKPIAEIHQAICRHLHIQPAKSMV